ncbi:MAG: type 4a pilus biogenesis protein PilO [Candidatus Omnitrophica bacterium]|nr:type 4a pilus biogenesis protein PilO [Candidatus Omnitrophota bacterium]
MDIKFKEHQKEIAVKIAVGIGAVVLGFMLVVNPFLREVRDQKRKIDDSRAQSDLFVAAEISKARLEKLERFFLSAADRSVILGKISDAASREKLDVETITPRTEPAGDYVKLTVELNARGSFFQLVKFLKSTDTFNPAIRIKGVSLSRNQQGRKKDDKLQATVTLETYLKQKVKTP